MLFNISRGPLCTFTMVVVVISMGEKCLLISRIICIIRKVHVTSQVLNAKSLYTLTVNIAHLTNCKSLIIIDLFAVFHVCSRAYEQKSVKKREVILYLISASCKHGGGCIFLMIKVSE